MTHIRHAKHSTTIIAIRLLCDSPEEDELFEFELALAPVFGAVVGTIEVSMLGTIEGTVVLRTKEKGRIVNGLIVFKGCLVGLTVGSVVGVIEAGTSSGSSEEGANVDCGGNVVSTDGSYVISTVGS